MIGLLGIFLGSSILTVPRDAIVVSVNNFGPAREYNYVCGGSIDAGKVAGVYAVAISPSTGGATVNVRFVNSYGKSEFREILKNARIAEVHRSKDDKDPTWFLSLKSASRSPALLSISPVESFKAVVSFRAGSVALDKLDCLEQPAYPEATTK